MSDTVVHDAGFYTMNAQADAFLPAHHETLCAVCALPRTQVAFARAGQDIPVDMPEALVVLQLQMTLNGDPEADTLLTYSDHGRCENCGKEA